METCLVLIKPDITTAKPEKTGLIINRIESIARASIKQIISIHIQKPVAEVFYKHMYLKLGAEEFQILIDFMCSAPCIAIVFERHKGLLPLCNDLRALVGCTDPEKAAEGTIRKVFGTDIMRNAVHCSASQESSNREIEILL